MDEELDISKLKYVLYVRKSTDDPQRQIRSIDDQVFECMELASRLGLNVVNKNKPLVETKSAKKPDQRPIFRQMLIDLKKGVYDGILAWNPDRLSRNMREGGEIIDMVDEDQIKDLKFVTHTFSKDANGKMLLGMAFVLSKQYSDDLSQKVTRGVRRSFAEGKTPTPKHGYTKDENGLYRPDGHKFELMVKAWELRTEGTSLEEISEFLNKNGYSRKTKTGKTILMAKQILTDVFKDPFYYGILVMQKTGQKVDLRDIYNFQPAITEEIYDKVQSLSYRRIKPTKPHKTAFYPLRMLLRCSFCGGNMYVAPSTGGFKPYLYARCDNKPCNRKKKSIRMKVIFGFIYDFLESGLNFTKTDYDNYYKNTVKLSDSRRTKLAIEMHSKQAILKKVDGEIKARSLGIIKLNKNSEPWKINENRINELGSQKAAVETEINNTKSQITNPEEDRLSLKDFLNLSKNAAVIVKSANALIKDEICRLIFLNLCIDESKVLSYQLKEPFATLIEQRQKSSSRGERTRTSDLCFPKAAL